MIGWGVGEGEFRDNASIDSFSEMFSKLFVVAVVKTNRVLNASSCSSINLGTIARRSFQSLTAFLFLSWRIFAAMVLVALMLYLLDRLM